MKFQLAGFDLREIENVVDQLQQMNRTLLNVIHETFLLCIQVARSAFRQQI